MPRSADNSATSSAATGLPLFAVAAPGLEPIVAAELAGLGLATRIERGGVAWDGTLAELYEANLRLRTASRILLRLGQFRARTFPELERHSRRLPWAEFIAPGRPVHLRVSCHKSRLYHEKAVAERIRRAIDEVIGIGTTPTRPGQPADPAGEHRHDHAGAGAPDEMERVGEAMDPDDDGAHAQLVVVRFHYDRCTISLDTSGALLHRRGYRQELARAPLRETLAAALIIASGWTGDAPLVDPFCGSGTIPIEAALIARRIAPGLAHPPDAPRRYAFQEWPGYDPELWDDIVARARNEIRPAAPTILGADRDRGAIAAATANAQRAGVLDDIEFANHPLSALEPPPGTGWLVTNPPYGVRIGERAPLRDLYATLGKIARERLPGWRIALLSADPRLESQLQIPLEHHLTTRNGGIRVRIAVGHVPESATS